MKTPLMNIKQLKCFDINVTYLHASILNKYNLWITVNVMFHYVFFLRITYTTLQKS